MDEPAVVPDPESPQSSSGADELIKQFVEHWGMMARAWGINPSMGELFALLYISGTDWTAEDLRQWLQVSRGNASMNLRELMSWGVVRKVHRPGERRELFRAETEVWTLFRRIVTERKRRELDPTLTVLDRILQLSEAEPKLEDLRSRVESLRQFFRLIDALVVRFLAFNSRDLDELTQFLSRVNLDHLPIEGPDERP
jgi:HTH-type transcriptional regulator, glycine betaine synthesis regulator